MRARAGRTLVVLTLAIGLFAAFANAALAADTLTPTPVVVTLPAGGSTTVGKALHLDGLPARADIIVAIDTTGSMGAALAKAKLDAVDICADVQAAIPGARFAAVEFQDYPTFPYGAPSDSPYELHTPGYTADCASFSAGVAAMTLGNGVDFPESNNRVHFEAYSDPALLVSRDPQATRFLVVLADAIPHSIPSFGACQSTSPLSDPGRNGVNESGGGDDIDTPEAIAGLNADDHTLLYISYTAGPNAHPCHEDMAEATGGVAVPDEEANDIGAFIIEQAEETPFTVDLQVSAGCLLGISFAPSFPQGPFSGEQTISFVETITAPTVPGSFTCTVTAVMSPGGPTTAVQTVNVNVTPGPPATLVLTPATDTNPVDDRHCVTATVRDAFGNPVPGATVDFSTTGGATPPSGSATTNASGQAEFCFIGPGLPATVVITANARGTTASGTATKVFVLPGSAESCKVTYGGRITAANGDKATFGGNAKADGLKGNENYQDHGPAADMHVKSSTILAVTCSRDGTSASIFGTATVDGAGSFGFRIDVRDLGEPGTGDRYRIRLSNGYDSGDQQLESGNIQIH
ncbi:MAG: Ig-like domain-containing protein [Actinomycetota bacterium]|nr:Ig-like domain-containing protein [Actinomycetota bacterium]